MELHLFEVVKFEKIKSGNRKIALVELSIPELDKNLPDLFLMDSRHETKLSNFFVSIGEKKRGEKYHMDWDHIIGKRGICALTKNNMVEFYVEIPYVSNLIQKYGAEEISHRLNSIQESVEEQNQIFSNKLEFLLERVKELNHDSKNFEEDKNNIFKYINSSIRYELTFRKKIMDELEHTIASEVKND